MIVKIQKFFWIVNALLLKIRLKKIGFPTYIGPTLFILGAKNIRIGNRVRIFPGLRIEVHNKGKIDIRDNISFGQNCHIICSDSLLEIGSHTTLSGNVFITNIDHDYQEIGKHILNQNYIVKTTTIGENCFIGYGVAIQAGTILGKQCIVGANSVVRGTFPDYCVIAGVPAKIVKRFNPKSGMWEKTDKFGEIIKNNQ